MLVGYVRFSTSDDRQSVDLQRDAFAVAGVARTKRRSPICSQLQPD